MEPWSGCLREYAPCLVISCPRVCLSVNRAFSDCRHLVSILSPCRVDHDKSCAASVANGCFLLAQLLVWNGFRSIFSIELRELRIGRLALTCLRTRVVCVLSKIQCSDPFVLVHGLLMEEPSIEFLELRSSSIFKIHLFFRYGIEQSGSMRHGQICCYQLLDCPPRELKDAHRFTVTPLNLLKIVSAYFSSVGVHMLCAQLVMCEALCTLVFLENWIDVPEADTLTCCGAAHHGLRKIQVDSRHVLADLVKYSAVIDELVVSHRSRCTYGKPHGFAALFPTVADRGASLKTFEMYNLEVNLADLRGYSMVLSVSAKTGEADCHVHRYQRGSPVFSRSPKIHASGSLVLVVNLGDTWVTLKKAIIQPGVS